MNAKAAEGRTRIGDAQIESIVQFLDPTGSGTVGYEEFFDGLRVQTDTS